MVKEEGYLSEKFKEQFGEPTFAKFVKKVLKSFKNRGSFNIHWEPYILSCSYCHFNYTFLSKLETMEEDQDFILQYVGADIPKRKERHCKKIYT